MTIATLTRKVLRRPAPQVTGEAALPQRVVSPMPPPAGSLTLSERFRPAQGWTTDDVRAWLRIIGVELRLRSPTGTREEMAVLPVDIAYPQHSVGGPYNRWSLDATVHTSLGDVTFVLDLPA